MCAIAECLFQTFKEVQVGHEWSVSGGTVEDEWRMYASSIGYP